MVGATMMPTGESLGTSTEATMTDMDGKLAENTND